ncbi:MAG TPA: PAS domain S-box protein [Rhodocyclaceae bacterium]
MKPRAPLAPALGATFGFLVFMAVFVIGVGLSTGYTIYRLRQKAIDEHFQIADMHAHAVEDHLTQSFNIISQTLANLGDIDDRLAAAQITRRFEIALLTSPALRSISLLDAQGRIFISSNAGNLGARIDTADFLPPHGENTELPRIGRPWSGRDFGDGAPPGEAPPPRSLGFIPVVKTLHVGQRVLTLATAVNPDYFVNHYSAQLHPDEGFIDVLRYDGTMLLSTAEPPAGETEHKAFIRQISDIESGSLEETLPGAGEVLTSFRASRTFPLVVVAHMTMDHALAEWTGESRRLLAVATPTLLAVVVLTTLLFVHLRRIEEQKAEARQREHDRLAATVFRSVDSGVMLADAQDRVIAVNPAFTRITGYAEEEMVGRRWQTLAAPDEGAELFAAMTRALAAADSWHGEVWHRHRGGERYIAWQSVNPVHDEDGQLAYRVVAFSDITDRKKAEEAQLRAVIEASPEAVLLVEADGRVSYANRVSERMFGYTQEEALGLDVNSLVPVSYRLRHQEYVEAFSREPQARRMRSGLKLVALHRSGREFPVEVSLSPMSMGSRFVVIAAISDITQRMRDEEALRASEERWKFALEGAGEGVWDWNVGSGETSFSKRILEVWGCAADSDAVHRLDLWTDRIHEDDKAVVAAALQNCLAGRRRTFAVEHRARRNDGHWHWALVHGMVVSRDGAGNPQRMIGTYADITERKTVERELTAAKEAAEALLERASMAERRILDISEQTRERIGQELHDDLGQHLTGAAFLSEILFRKLEAATRPEQEDAAMITRLINEAVAKTRNLAQGLYPVELKEAGLCSMLQQLARSVERTYVVECAVAADPDFALEDGAVAINLFRMAQEAISNAVRHGKATRIEIRMARTAAAMLLEIEDNGCGIAEGALDRGGLGMHTMRYRAALIGAELTIANGTGGAKVVIAFALP